MTPQKRVRFSGTTTYIYDTDDKEIHHFWYTRNEIEAFKVQRTKAIQHVQNIGMDIANFIDASDYMGLELHLSKRIERECEQHRQNYIQAIIDEQMRCLSTEDLANFARMESRNSVARSHEIGVFYANRPFDELSLELSLVPSRKHHLNLVLS